MSTNYRRADGLIFIVARSGRVYEMREVFLSRHYLEAQVAAGLLRREGDPAPADRPVLQLIRPAPDTPRGSRGRAP